MTKKKSNNKYLKGTDGKRTGKRQTLYDVKVSGTFAQPMPVEKGPARPLTYNEVHANNYAMYELMEAMGDLFAWKTIFEKDLERMNLHKRGPPFQFSDAQIIWESSILTQSNNVFRAAAGFIRGILKALGIPAPSFSRLNERINEITERYIQHPDAETDLRYGEHIFVVGVSENTIDRVSRCGIDASGLALSSSNRWRERKWGTGPKDKGWLQIHALCDVDTGEFIAYAITDESVGDAPLLKTLVELALKKGHKIDTLYADNAYCSDANWSYLCVEKKIKFITSFKRNTTPTSNGCLARGKAAKLWCSLPYEEWVRQSGYGTRWKCECGFSDFKRLFPETITAHTLRGIIRQLMCRVNFYNKYKGFRATIMGTTGNGIVVG